MAELVCADLSSRPVQTNVNEWLAAAQQLTAVGEFQRAQLLLNTVLQAEEHNVAALTVLIRTYLHLGGDRHLRKALQLAR